MNKTNMQHALNIMKRAKSVYMPLWQDVWQDEPGPILETEAELHACGTPACLGGYIAVSPEFIADGGGVCPDGGAPILNKRYGHRAMSTWLEITEKEAAALFYASGVRGKELYNKQSEEVTKEDVILVLEEMLGEEE